MAKTRKRKAATIAGVGALTAALLLGGTFAWQSISQMALNENKASVNPGARLHDDYTGNYARKSEVTNRDVGIKRVYVENFTKEDEKVSVIARVRLDEYMEIGGSAGYKKLTKTANGNYIKAGDDNGVIELVSEDTTTTSGSVIITVKPIPYTGNTIDTVTADPGTGTTVTANTDGTYTCTVPDTTPVTITATFKSGTTTGDTIEKAKTLVENANDGTTPATIDDVKTWKTYIPELAGDGKTLKDSTSSAFRNYVDLTFGWDSTYADGGIYYMPTFNKNKDSLSADINGTYAAGFSDYVDYADSANQTVTADAEYDNDANDVDDGNVYTEKEKHTAQALSKTKSNVISMAQWKTDYNMAPGDYWVYDTNDGWAYWANLLEPETATGLFLSRNEMTGTPEDNWYYGMNVVGQFVTSEDIGSDSNKVGFYADDAGEKPSTDAKTLLGILMKLNDAQTTSLESGQTLDVTYLKNEAQPISLTAQGGTWIVSDETVLTLSENEEKTQVIATAHKPGDAIIIYTASDGNIALTRVTVDYALYTVNIGAAARKEAETIGAISYAKVDENDTKHLTVHGTFEDSATGTWYQVAIGTSAFYQQTSITGLTLEEGIVRIAHQAFAHCSGIAGTVKIPSTADFSEATNSFFYCSSIEKLELPENVSYIPAAMFMGCGSITEIEFPEGLLEMASNAFKSSGLTGTIKLPSSLRYMVNNPFERTAVTAFEISKDNEYFTVVDDVLYTADKKHIRAYPCAKEGTSFTIPDGVDNIIYGTFSGSKNLTSIVVPDTVETISSGFIYCEKLEEITLPTSITYFATTAFTGTTTVTTVNFAGTKAQWSELKCDEVEGLKNATIKCMDGDITPSAE